MFYRCFFSGTGSYPPLEKGLQRRMRHSVSSPPFNAPNRSIATKPYSEQVGIYLQHPMVLLGLIFLYSRINVRRTFFGESRVMRFQRKSASPYFVVRKQARRVPQARLQVPSLQFYSLQKVSFRVIQAQDHNRISSADTARGYSP